MRFTIKGEQLQASAGFRRSLPNLIPHHLGTVLAATSVLRRSSTQAEPAARPAVMRTLQKAVT
jgi:hypothetical protein